MTPRQRTEAWATLLASANERAFSRDGYQVTITRADAIELPRADGQGTDAAVRIFYRVRRNGTEIEGDWIAIGPPVGVPAGDEPNPDYDPERRGSQQRRPVFEQNVREAFRTHFLDVIAPRLGR